MKKIYIYLLFVVIGISPIYSQTTLTQANEAYGQEDYIKAIELYEQTLREQGVSSDLYYNLGNAYYKHNEFAKAILNYERALLLNPGNEDARFNLEMANTHIVDKIDPVGKFFLSVWIDSLRNFFVIEYMGSHRNSFISIVYRRSIFISVLQVCQSKEIRFFWRNYTFLDCCSCQLVCMGTE